MPATRIPRAPTAASNAVRGLEKREASRASALPAVDFVSARRRERRSPLPVLSLLRATCSAREVRWISLGKTMIEAGFLGYADSANSIPLLCCRSWVSRGGSAADG